MQYTDKVSAEQHLMALCYALLLTASGVVSFALGSTHTDVERSVEEDSLDLIVEPVVDYRNVSSLLGIVMWV